MLIFRCSKSLTILVIADAIHLNQVFLIWTAGNYLIHLRGTLPFSINHSVRLHQPHCVLVTAATAVLNVRVWSSYSSCLGSGQFSKQMIRKRCIYLGCTFSLLIQSLALPSFSPCH
jgi:hypothetical protein